MRRFDWVSALQKATILCQEQVDERLSPQEKEAWPQEKEKALRKDPCLQTKSCMHE